MSKTVLFVCTGNTCRSPMAEALLRHMLKKEGMDGVEVFSRGVGVWDPQPMSDGTRDALKAAGIEPHEHTSQAMNDEDADRADVIYVMTQQHRKVISKNYPEAAEKVRMLAAEDIPDPVGGSAKDFEKCRITIQNALLDLLPTLKTEERK